MTPPITMDFRIGAERYARRYWWAVPAVGDLVLLGAGKDRFKPDHNGDAMFRVDRLTWGAETPQDHDRGRQIVIAHVSHVDTTRKARS